ncbi:MarC family protein [Desulfolithobacter sp.]
MIPEYAGYAKTFIGILSIVNPLGAIPVFLSLSGGRSREECQKIARISAVAVAFILLAAAWTGDTVLAFFGISLPAFRTGGGLLILLMAIAMMHARQSHAKQSPEEVDANQEKDDIAVVPLAIPLMAGPGAISLVIVETHKPMVPGLTERILLSGCIILVACTVWLSLRLAEPIGKRLGTTGLNIGVRIMGLLLCAIGVQMIAEGLKQLFPVLG